MTESQLNEIEAAAKRGDCIMSSVVLEMVEEIRKRRWIPVTERLPIESDGNLLGFGNSKNIPVIVKYEKNTILCNDGRFICHFFLKEKKFKYHVAGNTFTEIDAVIAWQPLPEV